MRVPAAVVAVPLLAGAAAGIWFDAIDNLALLCGGGASIALIAGCVACLFDDGAGCAASVIAGAAFAGISLGSSAAGHAYRPPLLSWFQQNPDVVIVPVRLDGILVEDAAATPFGISLTLRVASVQQHEIRRSLRLDGGVRLSVAGSLAVERARDWRAGRRMGVTAVLREPTVYLNAGVPDERRALARRGVVLVGSVKSGALVEVLSEGSWMAEAAATCRHWTRQQLRESISQWSARSGGIATAILLGDRTGLAEEDERRLQEAGTYHVIAISGGNIAILTSMLLLVLRLLRVPPQLAAGLTILALQFYGAIVAAAPSVDRAITAATVYLAARLLDHRGPALNVLATAAVLAAAMSPLLPFDPGFILSFGATFGILVGVPRLMPLARTRSRTIRALAGLLAATIAAEIVLAPIGAAFFSRITIAGLFLNFAAVPLMSIVQAGSLLTLVASPVDARAALHVGYVVHLAAHGLVESARLVDVLPWLSRDVPPPAWWIVACYYAAVVLAVTSRRFRRGAVAIAAAAGVTFYSGCSWTSRDRVPGPARAVTRVVFLDVGQGDSTLVVLPDGRSVLVDAGGFPIPALQQSETGQPSGFDIGARVVAPALRALGVRRLDTVVFTHGDPDHIGGGQSILRLFKPRSTWEGVPVPPPRELGLLAAAADRLGAERRTVVSGDAVQLGNVRIRVLHPPLPEWERQRVRNEDSVVIEIRVGEVSIILPGDIGGEGEAAVLKHFERAPVVVLKAAHHGSASSSTLPFLAALRPAAVIFSAGRANRFGHPAPVVVDRYRASGTAMFSTAEDGMVLLDTDGRSVEMRGWTGRTLRLER